MSFPAAMASNVEALLDLGALAGGGLGGQGAKPGRLSEASSGTKHVVPYDGQPDHDHALAPTDRTSGWNCDVCRASNTGRRYRCVAGCDWDMCGTCWDELAARHALKNAPPQAVEAPRLPVVGGGNKAFANPWAVEGAAWAEQNPLCDALSAKPATTIAGTSGPAGDVEAFLLERHLWSENGLNRDALQRACKQLAGVAHSVLAAKFASSDTTGRTLKAQSAALKKLEKSTAAELQGKPGVPLLVTTPDPGGQSGVGDTSGLFHYLGTGCGSRPYSNPHGNGLKLTKGGDGTSDPTSSYDYGSGEMLLNNINAQRVRLYENYNSQGDRNHPWFQVQITSNDIIGFMPTHYKLRVGDGAEHLLREWDFSGSVDGKEWSVLDSGKNHPNAFTGIQQCKTFLCGNVPGFYKFFRIEQKASRNGEGRLDLLNWEVYGFLPMRTGKNAIKDAIKCINLESSAKVSERPTEEIFSDATIGIGLHMLDHLIRSAADAPLATSVLGMVLASVEEMKPLALHDSNRPSAVSNGQLDAIQDFLVKALPKTQSLAPDAFATAVKGLELLASRRGRLRDLLNAISALAGFEDHPLAKARHAALTAKLLDDCASCAQLNSEAEEKLGREKGSIKIGDALVDPCFESLSIIDSMLKATAGEPWDAASTALCWLAEKNLRAAAMSLTVAEMEKCEALGTRLRATAVATFDKPRNDPEALLKNDKRDEAAWLSFVNELALALLVTSVEFEFETSTDPSKLVDDALKFEVGDGEDTPPSALVVFNAVLDSVDSMNKCVCLLGPAKGADAAANLDNHEQVVSFFSKILHLSQAITDGASEAASADAPPPAAAMIGLLSRVQAAIWSHHRQKQDASSSELLNVYTITLLKFAVQQLARPHSEHGKAFAGPLGGLMPTWLAVMHDEDWSKWQDETLGAIQLVFKGMISAAQTPQVDPHTVDSAEAGVPAPAIADSSDEEEFIDVKETEDVPRECGLSYQKGLLLDQPQLFRGSVDFKTYKWSPQMRETTTTICFPGAAGIKADFGDRNRGCMMVNGCSVEISCGGPDDTAVFTGRHGPDGTQAVDGPDGVDGRRWKKDRDWSDHGGKLDAFISGTVFLSDTIEITVRLPVDLKETLPQDSPTDMEEAKGIAQALGLKVGGVEDSANEFAGAFAEKGLYAYKWGKYAGQAFFGQDSTNLEEEGKSPLSQASLALGRYRPWPPRLECTFTAVPNAPESTARRWLADCAEKIGYIAIVKMMQLGVTKEGAPGEEAKKEPSKALKSLIGKDRGTVPAALAAIAGEPADGAVGTMVKESFQAAGAPVSRVSQPKQYAARAAVFACLLHHGGLASIVDDFIEGIDQGDLTVPDAAIEAAKSADGIVVRVLLAAEDLGVDDGTLEEWLNEIQLKASFLLKFKSSLGQLSVVEAGAALSKTTSLKRAGSIGGSSLQRAMSEGMPLQRAASDMTRWSGALTKLQSVSRLKIVGGVSAAARQVFADVSAVLFDNSISTDVLDKGADSAEARCKDRSRGFHFVAQMLKRVTSLGVSKKLRRVAALRLLDPDGGSPSEHYLPTGATGSAELMGSMTASYWDFLLEIGLLDGSSDQDHDLENLAPALCCTWREMDWAHIEKFEIYQQLKGAKSGLVRSASAGGLSGRADGLVSRLLKLSMVLTGAAEPEHCSAALSSMISTELETLNEVDSIVAVALSLPTTDCSTSWLANEELSTKLLEHIFTLADPSATHSLVRRDKSEVSTATLWLPILNRCMHSLDPVTLDKACLALATKIGADTPEQVPGVQFITLLAKLATFKPDKAQQLARTESGNVKLTTTYNLSTKRADGGSFAHWNVRDQPSRDGNAVNTLDDGATVEVTESKQESTSTTWLRIAPSPQNPGSAQWVCENQEGAGWSVASETVYHISGAGVAKCNGEYKPRTVDGGMAERRDDVRCWSNANDVLLLRWRLPSGAKWWYFANINDLISGQGDYYRVGARDEADETPPITGWNTQGCNAGEFPLPTVRKVEVVSGLDGDDSAREAQQQTCDLAKAMLRSMAGLSEEWQKAMSCFTTAGLSAVSEDAAADFRLPLELLGGGLPHISIGVLVDVPNEAGKCGRVVGFGSNGDANKVGALIESNNKLCGPFESKSLKPKIVSADFTDLKLLVSAAKANLGFLRPVYKDSVDPKWKRTLQAAMAMKVLVGQAQRPDISQAVVEQIFSCGLVNDIIASADAGVTGSLTECIAKLERYLSLLLKQIEGPKISMTEELLIPFSRKANYAGKVSYDMGDDSGAAAELQAPSAREFGSIAAAHAVEAGECWACPTVRRQGEQCGVCNKQWDMPGAGSSPDSPRASSGTPMVGIPCDIDGNPRPAVLDNAGMSEEQALAAALAASMEDVPPPKPEPEPQSEEQEKYPAGWLTSYSGLDLAAIRQKASNISAPLSPGWSCQLVGSTVAATEDGLKLALMFTVVSIGDGQLMSKESLGSTAIDTALVQPKATGEFVGKSNKLDDEKGIWFRNLEYTVRFEAGGVLVVVRGKAIEGDMEIVLIQEQAARSDGRHSLSASVLADVEFEPEPEPEAEPEAEPNMTRSAGLQCEKCGRAFSSPNQLFKHLKNSPDCANEALRRTSSGRIIHRMIPESETPKCPSNGHDMEWSDYRQGAYAGGWSCNQCSASRSSAGGGPQGQHRWFCQSCNDDFCRICNPAPLQKETIEKNYKISLLLDQPQLYRGCVAKKPGKKDEDPDAIKPENKTMRGDRLTEAPEAAAMKLIIPVIESGANADVLLQVNEALRCLGSCYCAQVAFKALEHIPSDSPETLVATEEECDAVIKLLRQGHRNWVPAVLDGSVCGGIVDSVFSGDELSSAAKYLLDSQQDALLSVVGGSTVVEPLCVQTVESTHNSSFGSGENGRWEMALAFPDAESMRIEFDDRAELGGGEELNLHLDGNERMRFSGTEMKQFEATTVAGANARWDMRKNSSSFWGARATFSAATTSAVVESRHEYEPNLDFCGSVHIPGVTSMQVKFDGQTRTESGCDTLRFYTNHPIEGGGSPVHEFNGDNSRFNGFTWKGDTLHYRFNSDGSCQYWGFKFTVTAGTAESIPPSLIPQTSIASMVFEFIAKRKFGVAKGLLLSEKSLQMLKIGCYKTAGGSRRTMLKLIEALLHGAKEASAAVPDELAQIVCKLYEKSFEEAEDDTFGNASVSGLAALSLQLADAGWTGFFGSSEPEPGTPKTPRSVGGDGGAPDIADLRRKAITAGMSFRAAREASVVELGDFVATANAPVVVEWSQSATFRDNATWTLAGKTATMDVAGNEGYNLCAVGVAFPKTPGQHRVTVTITAASTMGVGVCADFDEVRGYGNDSYTWLGNGRHGWSLCNDGDGCNNGGWLGGDYSCFAYSSGSQVTVIFDASDRTLSFEVNGQVKANAYRDLPEEVYLCCALQGPGAVTINETSFDGASSAGGAGRSGSAFDALANLAIVNQAVEALSSGTALPEPFRVAVVDPKQDSWVKYMRDYFIASASTGGLSTTEAPPLLPEGLSGVAQEPSWGWPEDLAVLNLISTTPEVTPEGWVEKQKQGAEENTALDKALSERSYRVLEGRRDAVLRRAPLLCRFAPMLLRLLPIMSMDSWYGCRDMIPKDTKTRMLKPLLAKAKRNGPQPSVKVNRQTAMGVDNSEVVNVDNSIFVQVYNELGDHARSDAIFRGSSDKWFSVSLIGEHAQDAGGVFRETISNMGDDLMSERTPLFIKTPNQREQLGDQQDMWMPNPSCKRFDLYEFVGRLMAGAIQTDENIVVQLSPFVWRRIGGASCTPEQFKLGVSSSLANYEQCAEMDEETFEFCCNTWAVQRSDGTMLDLLPGGSEVEVLYKDKDAWLEKVKESYLTEVDEQCAAIRRGLLGAAIPLPYLVLTSSDTLERAIAGDPDVTVEGVQKHTTIGLSGPQTAMFWECVTQFTVEERSRLLQFATGRTRLPVKLVVEANGDAEDSFPKAATCYQKLYMPTYSSQAVMAEKLLYALTNCMAIDTDG